LQVEEEPVKEFSTPEKVIRKAYNSPNITPMGNTRNRSNSNYTPQNGDGTYYFNNITNNIIVDKNQVDKD
jgi:hypothetical protein